MFSKVVKFRIVFPVIFVGVCFIFVFILESSIKNRKAVESYVKRMNRPSNDFYAIQREPKKSKHSEPLISSSTMVQEDLQTKNVISKEKLIISMADNELIFEEETRTTTPVYIVEEHHEVVPYWFQETRNGRIPKHGNILIHIDGHPDFIEPAFPTNSYAFRSPKTRSDIKNLMTSNDAFIMSAAYTGFFSRVIFIYPSWDKDRRKQAGDYDRGITSFGYIKGKTHKDKYSMCVCYECFDPHEGPSCHVIEGGEKQTEVDVNDCEFKQTIITEVLSDSHATKLVKSTDWITSLDNIIFDIDEDYYGCEVAIQKILDAKINEKFLDNVLGTNVEKLFCAENAKIEMAFDKIHYDLLREMASRGKLSTAQRKQLVLKTEQIIVQRNLTHHLCVTEDFSAHLENYIKFLRILNKKQLKAIAETGICLQSSPREASFDKRSGMKYCVGYLRPHDDVVPFFTPLPSQIQTRTQQLQTIFKNLPDPLLVTLCRSGRDGYLPRKYAAKIENDILKSLKKVYPGITPESFHYDSNLLGGKSSWYGRHGHETWW